MESERTDVDWSWLYGESFMKQVNIKLILGCTMSILSYI